MGSCGASYLRAPGCAILTFCCWMRHSPASTARLYDFGDGQVLRMIGLQMRGNQAHAPFEDFERHSRLDAHTLDAAANRDTMIPIQST